MPANPLEEFLRSVQDIHRSGAATPETAYYGSLENLLNEVGKRLKPKVRCFMSMKNLGAGMPDGGLFTANQYQKAADAKPRGGQTPARGAIEAKGVGEDVADIAREEQVGRYLGRYGLVLVTTFREFLLLDQGDDGKPRQLESYSLCADNRAFWLVAPRTLAEKHGERFVEFLKRVLMHKAPLKEPRDLAWFLASYARDARARIENVELPALAAIRQALEDALGLRFEGEKGEHFFRSTLVQTLFYGVFSAWVLWHKEDPRRTDSFNWHDAGWSLHVPMIATLFGQISQPDQLRPLDLVEVLDWTGAALQRVDRSVFFEKFEEEHAVQYFYEPFLEAFDPELRKDLGVWYTPHEIVKYQVARVDTVLREELDIPDGLADPRVVVLDPCCGTGAYLVEVLSRIGETLREKGGDALIASDLKKAAKERVFGFEILPAPFVISHMQLGLALQRFGAPLNPKSTERVGVYLTNALTGWEPPKEPKTFLFPEMKEEHDAAEKVKRDARILVVLGNPPYNAFAGISPEEEQGLVEPYKKGLNKPVAQDGWGIKKFNLDELYVRFFRMAERRIADMTGQGVVSFISNFSYLSDASFVVMRQRFLAEFDKLWIDCMNGDSRETGKVTPEGKPDPSVFSTDSNREGIRVGTAICCIIRKPKRQNTPSVRLRYFWGATKRADLLTSLNAKDFEAAYTPVEPRKENRFSLRPESVSAGFRLWATVAELCDLPPTLGVLDNRQEALIRIDRLEVEKRAKAYLDSGLSLGNVAEIVPELTRNYARFDAVEARQRILRIESFSEKNIRPLMMRPMDTRWCYYTPVRPVWVETRPRLVRECWQGNVFLVARNMAAGMVEGLPLFLTRNLGMQHAFHKDAYYIPLGLKGETDADLYAASAPHANLSKRARVYLTTLEIKNPDADAKTGALTWMHVLAIGYSPAYLKENADGIRRDWPRVPLPNSRELLESSASLGRQVAALLDTESGVAGVTEGKTRAELRVIGNTTKVPGVQGEIDLALTVGWGHAGKGGITMPGKGKVIEREYDADELDAIRRGAGELGLGFDQVRDLLGSTTCDIYLNDSAYWKNIPANVWDYTIGGYQVVKKWLSYREKTLLGRSLKVDEVREVMNMARRIAAIILLQPALDDNYLRVKDNTYPWPRNS